MRGARKRRAMGLDLRVRILMWLAARSGRRFRSDLTTEQFRAGYAQAMREVGRRTRKAVATCDVVVETGDGTIGARLYRPVALANGPAPLLVFFHGGGFVVGDVAGYDGCARFLAVEGELLVLSVELPARSGASVPARVRGRVRRVCVGAAQRRGARRRSERDRGRRRQRGRRSSPRRSARSRPSAVCRDRRISS